MGARILVVPAACLIAGLLVGFLFAPGIADAPPPAPEVASRVPPAPVRGTREIPESLSPEPGTTSPREPLGSGRIQGRVTMEDGTPVAGVVVMACRDAPQDRSSWHAVPRPVSSQGPPDLDRELAKSLRRIESDHRYREATRREAVSGEDGSFVLTGLSEGSQQILGFKEGYDLRRADDRGWVRPGETVSLIAHPVIRLPVSVLLPDGTPAVTAEIYQEGGFEYSASWSPERCVLDVPPGTLTLSAHAGDGKLKSKPLEIEVPAVSPADQVVLRLEGPQGIEGTVLFPRGMNRSFVDVVAIELPPGASASPGRLLEEGRKVSISSRSNQPGIWRMEDLAPGRYLIGVVRSRKGVLSSTLVTIGYGMETLDFVLLGAEVEAEKSPSPSEPEPKGVLIRVFDPKGAPEFWVRVSAAYRDPEGNQRSLGRVKRVEPGVFRASTVGAGSDGTCLISVKSEEYGIQDVEFDPVADSEVAVHLMEPAFVKVFIKDYVGSRYDGKTRILLDRPGRLRGYQGWRRTPPEPDGSQVFGPLAPGEWEIVIWFGMASTPLLTRKVTLNSGRQEIPLDLPRLFNLDVLVEGVDGEKGYYLRKIDGFPGGPAGPGPLTDGRICFEGLQAGEYLLSRHFGPRQHMPLTLTGDLTVRFKPIVLDALLVEISSPSGALAQSGLVHGDLILAIDGAEITSSQYGWYLQKLGASRGSTILTILRNGNELKQTVKLSGLRDPDRAGGEIKPWRR